MGTLVHELTTRLPERALRLGRRVERLERAGDGRWRVQLDGDTLEVVDGVISCMPAFAAAEALAASPMAEVLCRVPYVSTATVFFALAREPKQRPLDGAGFIVPRSEGRVLASTWVSSKWPGRAPAGAVLLRAFLGGAREPELIEKASDDELLSIAREELTRFMGPLEPVLFTRVFRWQRSNPQPTLGHAARIAKIESLLRDAPGLQFAGFAYDGIGIPDCIRRGRAAADAVLQGL